MLRQLLEIPPMRRAIQSHALELAIGMTFVGVKESA
jgi:hypothetical protein